MCSSETDFALKAIDNVYEAYQGGANFTGISFGALNTYGGTFTAIDARTNKIAWQKKWTGNCYSGSVATGGNLVFVGRNAGSPPSPVAFQEAFDEIRSHQMAMLNAIRAGYAHMLAEFEPKGGGHGP